MTVLYTSQDLYAFTLYSEQFYYSLTQQQAQAYPIILPFFENKNVLRVLIDDAKNAVDIGQSIYNAQTCLDNAALIVNNSQYLFP